MAKKGIEATESRPQRVEVALVPKSSAVAERGLSTARDVVQLLDAVISDIIGGRISYEQGNAAVNACGKMLKVVEMQHRYGKVTSGGKLLNLLGE